MSLPSLFQLILCLTKRCYCTTLRDFQHITGFSCLLISCPKRGRASMGLHQHWSLYHRSFTSTLTGE